MLRQESYKKTPAVQSKCPLLQKYPLLMRSLWYGFQVSCLYFYIFNEETLIPCCAIDTKSLLTDQSVINPQKNVHYLAAAAVRRRRPCPWTPAEAGNVGIPGPDRKMAADRATPHSSHLPSNPRNTQSLCRGLHQDTCHTILTFIAMYLFPPLQLKPSYPHNKPSKLTSNTCSTSKFVGIVLRNGESSDWPWPSSPAHFLSLLPRYVQLYDWMESVPCVPVNRAGSASRRSPCGRCRRRRRTIKFTISIKYPRLPAT